MISSAVNTPVAPSFTHGLWSDEREAWAASPIVPSEVFERLGAIRFIWERRVSRLFARRQVIAFLSTGACREAFSVVDCCAVSERYEGPINAVAYARCGTSGRAARCRRPGRRHETSRGQASAIGNCGRIRRLVEARHSQQNTSEIIRPFQTELRAGRPLDRGGRW